MSLERGFYQIVLGAIVERLRDKKQIKQADLGQRLGVSQSVVSRIENGMAVIDVLTFDKLATVLGLSRDALHNRVLKLAEKARAAERSVSAKRIPSRDDERRLVAYVVAVCG